MLAREKWRYLPALTITQIALLIEGYDPSEVPDDPAAWSWEIIAKTKPIRTGLLNSLFDQSLNIHCRIYRKDDFTLIDYDNSLICVNDLIVWMNKIGLHDGFFIRNDVSQDIDCPFGFFYAPKLAAANAAWKAVSSDPKLRRGKSPKQAIEAWLKDHAAEYGLLNKDGGPNATGIEEIAKVANWKPEGGAPKTPKAGVKQGEGFRQTGERASPNPGDGSGETILNDEWPF